MSVLTFLHRFFLRVDSFFGPWRQPSCQDSDFVLGLVSIHLQGVHLILCFFLKMLLFFWTLPVLLQRLCFTCLLCVHTLTPSENRERPESGIFVKTQYLNNTLYYVRYQTVVTQSIHLSPYKTIWLGLFLMLTQWLSSTTDSLDLDHFGVKYRVFKIYSH